MLTSRRELGGGGGGGGGKGEVLYLLAVGLPGAGQLVNWLSVLRSAED